MSSVKIAPGLQLHQQYEAEVPVTWRTKKHLRIAPSFIEWGDERVMLDQVTAVAWASRLHAINLTQSTHERLVRLRHSNGCTLIRFGGGVFGPAGDPTQQEAFGNLLACIDQSIEPRLQQEMLDRLADGEIVDLANFQLSASGLHHLDRNHTTTTWSESPTAVIDGNRVTLKLALPGGGIRTLERNTQLDNAILLPGMLAAIALGQ